MFHIALYHQTHVSDISIKNNASTYFGSQIYTHAPLVDGWETLFGSSERLPIKIGDKTDKTSMGINLDPKMEVR